MYFLFLSFSFLNRIGCLNIPMLLSPVLFCSYFKAAILLKRFIAIENRRQKSHWRFQTRKEKVNKKVIKVKSWKHFILQGKRSVSKSQFNFSCHVDYPAPMNRQNVLVYLPLCTYFNSFSRTYITKGWEAGSGFVHKRRVFFLQSDAY